MNEEMGRKKSEETVQKAAQEVEFTKDELIVSNERKNLSFREYGNLTKKEPPIIINKVLKGPDEKLIGNSLTDSVGSSTGKNTNISDDDETYSGNQDALKETVSKINHDEEGSKTASESFRVRHVAQIVAKIDASQPVEKVKSTVTHIKNDNSGMASIPLPQYSSTSPVAKSSSERCFSTSATNNSCKASLAFDNATFTRSIASNSDYGSIHVMPLPDSSPSGNAAFNLSSCNASSDTDDSNESHSCDECDAYSSDNSDASEAAEGGSKFNYANRTSPVVFQEPHVGQPRTKSTESVFSKIADHSSIADDQEAIAASHGFYKWNSKYKIFNTENQACSKPSNTHWTNEQFKRNLRELSVPKVHFYDENGIPTGSKEASAASSDDIANDSSGDSSSDSESTTFSIESSNDRIDCESPLYNHLGQPSEQTKPPKPGESFNPYSDLNLSQHPVNICLNVTPTEPLDWGSVTPRVLPHDVCQDRSIEQRPDIQSPSKNSTSEAPLSPYEYMPGNISVGNDWSAFDSCFQAPKDIHQCMVAKEEKNTKADLKSNEIEEETPCDNFAPLENDSDSYSDGGSEISESDVYYKYRDETSDLIKKTQTKVRQRLTKKGIKKRQRIFPDRHGIKYKRMKFHKSYKTRTFKPSNVNPHLEQFIPTIVEQRKQSTSKRLKLHSDTLEDLYKLPPKSVKIKFGDTEVIKYDKEGKIIPLVNTVTPKRVNANTIKSILKTTKKESPTEWETLIGDDVIKHNLARIFNICNIPLETINNNMEIILEKIAAAMIVESGNKEYCSNYQSLYDEIKFEEYNKTMKKKIKDLKKLLDAALRQNKQSAIHFREQLDVNGDKFARQREGLEAAIIKQRKEYEDLISKERDEVDKRALEDFEEFEEILRKEGEIYQNRLIEERKDFENKLNKEREGFERSLERERAEHAAMLKKERQAHSQALELMRKKYEESLTQEEEKIARVEKDQSTLFNSAVEKYQVRERITAQEVKYMKAEFERKHIENVTAQKEIDSLLEENAKLRELMRLHHDESMKLKPEIVSLKGKLSKQDQWKDRYKDRYIAICTNLSCKKKELKMLKNKNNSLLKDNKGLKDLVGKLQGHISESKETIEDCKDFIEGIQSHIKHCKQAFTKMDKEHKDLNENFLKIANVHFPLQNTYTELISNYTLLQKEHQTVCKENERKDRDIKRANEQLVKANEKVKEARKCTKGKILYVPENEDDYNSVVQMPLEFLKEKEPTPLPAPVPFIKPDLTLVSPPKLIIAPIENPGLSFANRSAHFQPIREINSLSSKRGAKRKILRSLANKMSLSHHTYEKSIQLIA
ncbi:hypothetical protein HG535_0G02480 [Zygotorulaspora mrakii]|uniref:Uncharacterized protein n=1 Tax=Zygotorulaspora mrakii TaxID=42260 RepID=A0A7H9B7Z3_ZYGMR|nr:uncharacterized protein HG535_0G02480 [Zygotorulaspora mrakii]QLG74364.1 hypothetical protein HG535_0G02480 [Zygotorulaspora mrakii]